MSTGRDGDGKTGRAASYAASGGRGASYAASGVDVVGLEPGLGSLVQRLAATTACRSSPEKIFLAQMPQVCIIRFVQCSKQ